MKTAWSLTTKLVATGTTFLVLALLSTGLTLWVTWNLEGGAAAINEAGRLRMLTYRIALGVAMPADPKEVGALIRVFDESLALLETGDPSRPLLVPHSGPARARFAAVRTGWSELRNSWQAPASPEELRERADRFAGLVDRFVGAIEEEIARWTTILHVFLLALMALAIASAVAMLYTGNLLVLEPLARLRRAVATLQQGDLSVRVEVDTRDEFGELSAGFNDMARTLESLYGRLEQKVQEKTRMLEVKRQRLADLYEVSEFLARAPTLDALARGFARQVRRIARADAAAVRWCDEGNLRYHLLAGDGLPQELAKEEACLLTGSCHCGQAARAATTRVIPIVAADDPADTLCARVGFATVVSVPVILHERVLGEVDLFFRAPVEVDAAERELLDALASHLASAMESLRASALEREAAVAEERGMLARELHDSIAQALAFMKIQVKLLRQASRRGDAQAVERIIGELDEALRESHADVRELLVHFRTRASEGDVAAALRTTLQKFEHQTGLPARLVMEGHGVPVAPDVQVQVLHVLQEALSNVRKHAHASQVTVRVTPQPAWRFEVQDDGVGFETSGAGPGPHHVGLRIMQERAARIGAQVEVISAPGQGCRVVLQLPVRAGEAASEPALAQAD